MAHLTFKGKSYYAVFNLNLKRVWRRIGRVGKKEAKKLLRYLEVEFERDRLNVHEIKKISLYEYIDKYMDYTKTNKAESSYKRELKVTNHLKSFFGNVPLNRIASHTIEIHKSKRVGDGLMPRGVNKELAVLRFMLRKAVEWRYLKDNPFVGIKLLKASNNPVKFLNVEEIDRLIRHASMYLKPILIVMINTGIRTHELLNLKFSDIDYDRKTLLIRSQKANNFRVMPLNEECFRTLLWLKDNFPHPNTERTLRRNEIQKNYVFCDLNGCEIGSIRTSFYKACRRAGIKTSPHALRHSFASHLIMNGAG